MRLRRRVATLLVASLSLSTSAVALSTPTPVGAVLPGVIDVAVTIDAKPSVVSPPGEYALYAVQASNPGLVSAGSATVTVALPQGSVYDDGLSTATCSGTGAAVTCPVGTLAPGTTVDFDIVASTPTVPSPSYEATATITPHDLVVEPLEYRTNNTDTAPIEVRAASGAGAFGLVRGGDSIELNVADGRKYRMTVPTSSPGVIVTIRPDEGTAKLCGADTCGKGFHTDFVQHPYFKAEDPANPLFTTKTFGLQQPCHGLGSASDCTDIFVAKSPLEPALVEMPACLTDGVADPVPCLDRKRHSTTTGTTWFDVLMLSNDPIELPPLKLNS